MDEVAAIWVPWAALLIIIVLYLTFRHLDDLRAIETRYGERIEIFGSGAVHTFLASGWFVASIALAMMSLASPHAAPGGLVALMLMAGGDRAFGISHRLMSAIWPDDRFAAAKTLSIFRLAVAIAGGWTTTLI